MRQALHQLSLEGVIFKVHGKGAFVSKPKAHQNISQLQGFAEAMSGDGHLIVNEVVSVQFVPALIQVASKLKLPVQSQVTDLRMYLGNF